MVSELAIIVGLVLLNGVLAGAEIAIVGINESRLRSLMEVKRGRAHAVHQLRSEPERFFATVQVGITVIGATAGALGGATFAEDLEPLIASLPYVAPYAGSLSLVLVVGLLSILSVVLGELVPKSLALRYADSYSLLMGPPILWLSSVARPIVWFLTACSNVVLSLFGDRTTFSETRLSPAEIRELVDQAAEAGSLDPTAGEIATRALDFANLTAAQVMVPRTRIVAIPADVTPEELKNLTLEHGYSRFPVYQDHLDAILGYVLVKDMLAMAWEGKLIVLSDLLRPPYFAASTATAGSVLQHMRENRIHLAIVVDEHGGTAGILTIEDLVEEVVGDIFSEVSHTAEVEPLKRMPDGSVVVPGDTPIRELNRELDVSLEEGSQWSTVGGLSAALAGRVPDSGAELTAPDGTRMRVEAASERRVLRVRIWPPERPSDANDDETAERA